MSIPPRPQVDDRPRRPRRRRSALVLLATGLLVGCGGSSALLQDAEDAVRAARTAETQRRYPAALAELERALKTAGQLATAAPGTGPAKAFQSGELPLGPYTVAELRQKVLPRARVRASAVSDPAACALLVAERVTNKTDRTQTRLDVVEQLQPGGEPLRTLTRLAIDWIEPSPHRAEAYGRWAEALHKADPKRHAEVALKMAEAGLVAARGVDNVLRKPELLAGAVQTFLVLGRPDRALAVARAIPQGDPKTGSLTRVAMALGVAGRGDEATIVLTEALEASETIDSAAAKAERLTALAEIYARGEAVDGARRLLERAAELAKSLPITPAEKVLDRVVAGWALLGDPRAGAAAARLIASEDERGLALARIAALPTAGAEVDEAIATLKGLEARSAALSARARGVMTGGREARALEIAASIPDPQAKARALIAMVESGVSETLVEAAAEAARAVFQARDRADALTRLASALIGADRADEASAMLREAYDEADGQPDRLLAIGRAAMEVGQPRVAQGALRQVPRAARVVTEPSGRGTLILDAGAALAKLTDGPDVAAVIGSVLAAVKEVEIEGVQARLLTRLTQLLDSAGAAAGPHLDQIAAAIGTMSMASRRNPSLQRLAAAAARLGRFAAARKAADAISTPLEVDAALVDIAGAAADKRRFGLAVSTAEACSSDLHRARALARVGRAWTMAGRPSDPAVQATLRRIVTAGAPTP